MAEIRDEKENLAGQGSNPFVIQIIPGKDGKSPTVSVPEHKIDTSKEGHNPLVKWTCSSDDWAVVFNGDSPFEAHCYHHGKPGNSKLSGLEGGFKYSVFVDGLGIDPVIIVTR